MVGIAWLMVAIYNFLTPYLSDDVFYACDVVKANSFWDLVKQQYAEYLSNSGRIIGQFHVRLSLVYGKEVFNIVNSSMFIGLSLLIYANIQRRKKYDLFLYLLIITFLWRFTVDFGQTMLWICGSCNYLWGCVIILGFVTFYRYKMKNAAAIRHPLLFTIGTLFFGVWAGWCNENTSGGGLLLVLITLGLFILHKEKGSRLPAFAISGPIGMMIGLLGIVMAPGVRSRSSTLQENYSGIVGLISRFYKCTMTIEEIFGELLIMLCVIFVLLVLQKKIKHFYENESIQFTFVAMATSYALILVATTANRAHFGAGVFLMIAVLQGIVDIRGDELWIKTAKYSLVTLLSLWLVFTYMDNLVNVARIYREDQERITLIKEANAQGKDSVVIPQLRDAFQNPYSCAHEGDLQPEPYYWINLFYETYYGVNEIIAIPRDEWNELYGNGDNQESEY